MKLSLWTVYKSPSDYPGLWVARRFLLDTPTLDVLTDPTLEGLRRQLPPGLYRLKRDPSDESQIVETWL